MKAKKYSKKIIAVVPARGGSKGVLRKNIKILNGKPLIYYILKTLSKVKRLDKIVLSTEDDEIYRIASSFNIDIDVVKRPLYLSKDSTPLTSVVQYESRKLFKKGYNHDFVLQISPASPLTSIDTINNILDLLISKKTDCAVTLKRIEHDHPYRAKILDQNNFFSHFIKNINVEKFISRQDLPLLYSTSGAIYGRTYELLQTFSGKDFCLGKKPAGVVVNDIEAINIDRQIDFEFASFILRKKKK